MPTLTTLRIRLPVWPFHSPLRTRLAKLAMWSSTACTLGTTFSPSTEMEASRGARRAMCNTARFSVRLIFLPTKHGVDSSSQAGLFGEFNQQFESFHRNAILRVVQKKANSLGSHKLAALWILGKELSQM